jgi:glutaredoxin
MTEPVEVVVVSSPGCHLCTDAQATLAELSSDYLLDVRAVEAASEEGRAIVAAHRPSMFPVVLVGGSVFAVGRLSRGKLRRVLDRRAV